MSEVIVITSGKGGVGKTTTVANIGTGLAAMGKRVAVVDTDIGLRNLDVVMGLENRIVYNLVDVINGPETGTDPGSSAFRTVSSSVCPDQGQNCRISGTDDQAYR